MHVQWNQADAAAGKGMCSDGSERSYGSYVLPLLAAEGWCEREEQAQSNSQTTARLLLCCTGSSPNHTNQRPAKVTHSTPFNLDSCTSYRNKTRHSSTFSTHSPTFFVWDSPICWSGRGRYDRVDMEICHQRRSTFGQNKRLQKKDRQYNVLCDVRYNTEEW